MVDNTGGSRVQTHKLWDNPPLPSPPPLFPSLPLPLEVGPLNTARSLGSAVRSAERTANLVHFNLIIGHLVEPSLLIFLRIN